TPSPGCVPAAHAHKFVIGPGPGRRFAGCRREEAPYFTLMERRARQPETADLQCNKPIARRAGKIVINYRASQLRVEIIAPLSRFRTLAKNSIKWRWAAPEPAGTSGVVGAVCLVVGITVILETLKPFVEPPPIIITYLIPVLIASIRWGYLSAFVATLTGAA